MEFGKVYEGDFLDVLEEELGYGWADLVCTGPSSYGQGEKRLKRETGWASAFKQALAPDGILVSVWPWKDVWCFSAALCQARFAMQRVHQVTGRDCRPNHAGGAVIVATVEPRDIPFSDWCFDRFTHPAWSSSFPVELAERAIGAYCPEGGVVLDPFFGKGTTAIAAVRLGRRWVGCELEGGRIQEAYARIERETDWRRKDAVQG